jgi:hypothetical protein
MVLDAHVFKHRRDGQAGEQEIPAWKIGMTWIYKPRAGPAVISGTFGPSRRAEFPANHVRLPGMAEKAVDERAAVVPLNLFNAVTSRTHPSPSTKKADGRSVAAGWRMKP